MNKQIIVVGNGFLATFTVAKLLTLSFPVTHFVGFQKSPSENAAGIVHSFNFKTATWKKHGFLSFQFFENFLNEWNLSHLFSRTGLFFETDEIGLWNDWNGLSLRFPNEILPKSNGVFFPRSGILNCSAFFGEIYQKFSTFSNYFPIQDVYKNFYQGEIVIHAGGIEGKQMNPDLPIYPKESEIYCIKTKLDFPFIYWKHFFLAPDGKNLYWIGPNGKESLRAFEKEFQLSYEIIDKKIGVKPYSKTGRAFIRKTNNIFWLNGAGGRGILEGIRLSYTILDLIKSIYSPWTSATD